MKVIRAEGLMAADVTGRSWCNSPIMYICTRYNITFHPEHRNVNTANESIVLVLLFIQHIKNEMMVFISSSYRVI